MELIQNDLTRTPAKGINITFRISKFDLKLPMKGMREMKFNLKDRFAIFVKKEKLYLYVDWLNCKTILKL